MAFEMIKLTYLLTYVSVYLSIQLSKLQECYNEAELWCNQ